MAPGVIATEPDIDPLRRERLVAAGQIGYSKADAHERQLEVNFGLKKQSID